MPFDYPEAYVDRPVILYDGMTQVELDEQFDSQLGMAFSDHVADLSASHAIGPCELGVDLGTLASFDAKLDTGTPLGAIGVRANFGMTQADHYRHDDQQVTLERRVHVVPGKFAAYYAVGVSLNENRVDIGEVVWTHVVDPYAIVEAEFQALPTLAVLVHADYNHPTAQSSTTIYQYESSADAGVTAILTLGREWDLLARFDVQDVTGAALPYLALGLAKRWSP